MTSQDGDAPAQRPAVQRPINEYTHSRARRVAWARLLPVVALFAAIAVPRAGGEVTFDQDNCNATNPCCISGDDVQIYLGFLTKSFCKIEYPIRLAVKWNQTTARLIDKKAMLSHKQLMDRGCSFEACKGYVCAEYFPRCFYVDPTTAGSFVFETCRATCESCYSTCTVDESPKCGGKPSQYEMACTSDSSPLIVSKLLLGAVLLICLRLVVL